MPVEIELKLAINPADAARLRRHPLLKGLKASRRKLYGIYFDTPDFDLYRRRGVFRLRREGYHWVQTVKLDPGSVGGLSMRPEYEVQVTGNQPDFEVLPEAARVVLSPEITGHLRPLFITDFQRTTWLVVRPEGTVEVALDIGHVRSGESALPLAEVELELKSGSGALLFAVAKSLLEAVPLVPEYRSKGLRGYGLAGAWRETPGKLVRPAVTKDMPAAEAWRQLLLAGLTQLGDNLPGLLTEDDPEYLHQVRVAVRRLHTVLTLGKPLGLAREDWLGELRWFMAELSPARDWDVLVAETLAGVAAKLPEPARLDGLLERAAGLRAEAAQCARAAAGGRRFVTLILDMGAALLEPCKGDPVVAKWARQAMDRRWRRFLKLAERFPRLDAAGWHQTRIAAKRLRYAGEAFAPLYGKRAERYLKRVAGLQDTLGAADDATVAHTLLVELNRAGGLDYAVGLVEGCLIGKASASAGKLAAEVARLARAKPFWR